MQNSQVMNIAMNLAKPVVDFLTSKIMLSVNPLDNAKLTKWRRIVDQADAFQKKQPGNSIAEIETFITTTFSEYTTDNAFERINIEDINADVGDHFLETKQCIQKGILGRAEVLRRQQNMKNYSELAEFFNKNLRGRFPFSPPAQDAAQPIEVDPEDMRLFFEKFKKAGGSAEKILDQIYQLGITTEAARFLRSVERVYDLFKGYLETDIGGLPSVNMEIIFCVNRELSVGANYVAEWSLRSNYDETIKDTDKVKLTKWVYGCPTDVAFRWPVIQGLLDSPFNDPKQPHLKVVGETATFTFNGKWSILRMIRQHRALPGEYPALINPNAIVLKFTVPVGENKRAILFISLSFIGPSTNPNMPGKTLEYPEFPTFAPALPEELDRYRNEPVLSFKVVQAAALGF
jgi:type VI secretion system protein ImpL